MNVVLLFESTNSIKNFWLSLIFPLIADPSLKTIVTFFPTHFFPKSPNSLMLFPCFISFTVSNIDFSGWVFKGRRPTVVLREADVSSLKQLF